MFVLVVDDDAVQRKLVRAWLEPMGFTVLTATSVIEAMQAMTTHMHISLCMVDWHMHPWSGPAFIAALRREPHFAKIPVLAFTADNDARVVKEAVALNVNGYILKPLHRRVIAEKLIALDLVETVEPARSAPGLPRALEARETLRVKVPVALDPNDRTPTKLYSIDAEPMLHDDGTINKETDEQTTQEHHFDTAKTAKQIRYETEATVKQCKSPNQ